MVQVARRVLQENGFEPDFPSGLVATIPAQPAAEAARDLRDLPWSSIDNDDSRDLDQIEVAEKLPDGTVRVLIGIADVDALVAKGSPIDRFAYAQTCSLYTGVHTFAMLPPELSYDRTSLLADGRERLAVITEIVVRPDGTLDDSKTAIYIARVTNKAKLAYNAIGAWLEGSGPPPQTSATVLEQLHLQDQVATCLRAVRHQHGALELETIEANPVTRDGQVIDLAVVYKSRASNLIEDLMIAANGATARYFDAHGMSSIRRIVRTPKRWERIVELAQGFGTTLPAQPSSKALDQFLMARRAADPLRFPDLSLSVIKLLGPGEYVLQRPDGPELGHFGLAVDDYAHTTAPNRRYPDLVAQRLLKAAAAGRPSPYSDDELAETASHCTERENAARKVERTMHKVAAAALLSTHIGQTFDAIVTGATDKGVYARTLQPPVDGRIVRGERGLDVGEKIRVKLIATVVERGFIDFERI
jgi:VacB/RNase II family 3'-5' exoribonuclease